MVLKQCFFLSHVTAVISWNPFNQEYYAENRRRNCVCVSYSNGFVYIWIITSVMYQDYVS